MARRATVGQLRFALLECARRFAAAELLGWTSRVDATEAQLIRAAERLGKAVARGKA